MKKNDLGLDPGTVKYRQNVGQEGNRRKFYIWGFRHGRGSETARPHTNPSDTAHRSVLSTEYSAGLRSLSFEKLRWWSRGKKMLWGLHQVWFFVSQMVRINSFCKIALTSCARALWWARNLNTWVKNQTHPFFNSKTLFPSWRAKFQVIHKLKY